MNSRKTQTILILSALVLSAFTLPSFSLAKAHGAGSLSINPATSAAVAAGTTVTINVVVTGMDSFNAWDISIQTDSGSLSGSSISYTGSLAGTSPTVLVSCVEGLGSNCGLNDGPGVAHSAVTFSTPTAAGASGTLFSVSYVSTGGPGSPIAPFADIIANAGASVTYTKSNGIYGTPNPDFRVDVSDPIDQNGAALIPGTEGSSVVTITSFGGLADTINLSLSASSGGITDSLADSQLALPGGGSAATTIHVSVPLTTLPGTYHQTVTALAISFGISRTADLKIAVGSAATVTATCGSTLSVVQGTTGTNPIVLTSNNGFFGPAFLSAALSPSTNAPTATTDPASLTLGAGGTGAAALYVSASSTTGVGTYALTLKVNYGTGTSSCSITVNVLAAGSPDFTLSANPTSVIAIRRVPYSSSITVANVAGFTGAVSTSVIILPLVDHGPTVTVTPVTGGIATLSFNSKANTQLQTYEAVVIVNSGSQSHSTVVSFTLQDFSIAARGKGNFPEFVITATECNTGLYSFGSLNGFNGVVTITRFRMVNINTGDIGFPTGVTVTWNGQPVVVGQTSVVLTSGHFVAGPLQICTTKDSPGGEYQLQTRGTTIVNGLKIVQSRNVFVQLNSFDLVPDTNFVVVQAKSSATVGVSVVGSFVEDLCCSAGFGTLPFLDFVTLSVASVTSISPGAFAKVTASIAPGPFFATDLINPSTPLTINVGPGGPGGLFVVTVSGVPKNTPALVRTTDIIVSVPSVLASIDSASVSISPGLATFTATVSNSATTTQFMQVVCSVVSTTPGGSVYTPSSSVVSVAVGGTATFTFTQALSARDSGQTFNFLCRASSGSTADQLLFVSKNKVTGSFTAL